MKKILFSFALCVFIFFMLYEINHYTMNGVVYEYDNDVIVLLDETDNLWEIETDYTDKIKIGDKIRITFDTNGTDDERIDDIITSVVVVNE